jgi:hypothetical protein
MAAKLKTRWTKSFETFVVTKTDKIFFNVRHFDLEGKSNVSGSVVGASFAGQRSDMCGGQVTTTYLVCSVPLT